MKHRSKLMMVLKDVIVAKGLTQSEAAQHFGVPQPRVSDLLRGKINLFGLDKLDKLVEMAVIAGLHIEMQIAEAA